MSPITSTMDISLEAGVSLRDLLLDRLILEIPSWEFEQIICHGQEHIAQFDLFEPSLRKDLDTITCTNDVASDGAGRVAIAAVVHCKKKCCSGGVYQDRPRHTSRRVLIGTWL